MKLRNTEYHFDYTLFYVLLLITRWYKLFTASVWAKTITLYTDIYVWICRLVSQNSLFASVQCTTLKSQCACVCGLSEQWLSISCQTIRDLSVLLSKVEGLHFSVSDILPQLQQAVHWCLRQWFNLSTKAYYITLISIRAVCDAQSKNHRAYLMWNIRFF